MRASPTTSATVEAADESKEPARLRHAATGLSIILFAFGAMMVALAAASLIGYLGRFRPDGIDRRLLVPAHAAFWIAAGVSLLGKLTLRLDGRALPALRLVDSSMLVGLVPYAVMGAIGLFGLPEEAFTASAVAVPVSFLLFARFLRSLAEQRRRIDLAGRAGRLLRFSTNMLIIALIGAAMSAFDPVIGSLLLFGAMLASCVAAARYGRLLFEIRRLV